MSCDHPKQQKNTLPPLFSKFLDKKFQINPVEESSKQLVLFSLSNWEDFLADTFTTYREVIKEEIFRDLGARFRGRVHKRKRMAVVFTNLSCWLWGGKEHETTNFSSATSLNSSLELNSSIRESDMVKFTSVKGDKMRGSATRKVKRKWHSREERRIDKEYDVVLVPSDSGWGSGSESDDSDWSIGWMEPHAPDFQSFDESENSFAVLVPCYAHGNQELVDRSMNQRLGTIVDLTNKYSDAAQTFDPFVESKEYLEHWLSSLQST